MEWPMEENEELVQIWESSASRETEQGARRQGGIKSKMFRLFSGLPLALKLMIFVILSPLQFLTTIAFLFFQVLVFEKHKYGTCCIL